MSDELSQPAREQADGPLAGERLAEARRLRQISLPDIARELHLDEPKVQALEENRFDMLGAPVFARGHLRKYAEIVGVPVDAIMADYHKLSGTQTAPPIVGKPRPHARDINLGPWIIGIPLLLIVLAAAYWWSGRVPGTVSDRTPLISQPTDVRNAEPAQQPVAEPDNADTATGVGADESASPPPVAAEPGSVPEPEFATDTAEQQDASVAPPANQLTLSLTYSGDCWTEVTDAAGNRLFFDLGRAGRTVSVSGDGPFQVLLGDSANVALTVNGSPYPLAGAERRGDTARLTINQ